MASVRAKAIGLWSYAYPNRESRAVARSNPRRDALDISTPLPGDSSRLDSILGHEVNGARLRIGNAGHKHRKMGILQTFDQEGDLPRARRRCNASSIGRCWEMTLKALLHLAWFVRPLTEQCSAAPKLPKIKRDHRTSEMNCGRFTEFN